MTSALPFAFSVMRDKFGIAFNALHLPGVMPGGPPSANSPVDTFCFLLNDSFAYRLENP